MKRTLLTGVAFLMLVGMPSSFGHHSPAVFDQTQEVILEGIVTQFRWTNPHSWIELNVRNEAGDGEPWAIEMTGPAHLVRAGWTRSTLAIGDEVRIVANPLRTSEKVGKFVSVTLPDGEELSER